MDNVYHQYQKWQAILLHFPIWLHPAESLRTLVAPDVRFYVGFLGHHFCWLCNRQAQNNSLFRLRVERDDSGRKLQRVARSGGLGLEGGNLHSTGGGLASISVCLNLRPVLSIGPRSSLTANSTVNKHGAMLTLQARDGVELLRPLVGYLD